MNKLPSYSVPKICKLYAKLYHETFIDRYGNSYAGDDFHELVSHVLSDMPKGTKYEVLRESMIHLAGQMLNDNNVKELCWRLAGNHGLLKAGAAVYPWVGQKEPEWVPVQVTKVWTAKQKIKGSAEKRQGAYVRFRVLGGRCCPAEIEKFWSARLVGYLRAELGFSRWNKLKVSNTVGKKSPNFPYYNINELFHLRMMVLIEPQLCKLGQPDFKQVRGSGTTKAWNRRIFKLRHRLGFVCPFGFSNECYRCVKGLSSCPAACHPQDYLVRECEHCKQLRVFDPTRSEEFCLACLSV